MPKPKFAATNEVRFAIVMYGGSSLAVYINGVVQELFHLVRATAPNMPTGKGAGPTVALLGSGEGDGDAVLSGTEEVYRVLGQLADESRGIDGVKADDPILTRFIVDILSGTSAGGINAVFLAKALANNQSMDQIKQLWLDEADTDRLLNDSRSTSPRNFPKPDPPESLLSGQLMYYNLLNALRSMEAASPSSDVCASPFVDELDLYITATDILGLTLPIRLSDGVVYERRNRNIFHFIYSADSDEDADRNDFYTARDPFLAFAARCTSAFPFAFSPMRLTDIDAVLPHFPEYALSPNLSGAREAWKRFYSDYIGPDGKDRGNVPFEERAFADGGVLDNKPFTQATEALMRRQTNVRVERKLIYVEPNPANPETEIDSAAKPDAVETVYEALLNLPRNETIREDLQRVRDRNQDLAKIDRLMSGVEEDFRSAGGGAWINEDGDAWAEHDLAEMIGIRGVPYGAYHRLKVSTCTDDLARLITRVSDLDERSDQMDAVRYLVSAWRDTNYVRYRADDPSLPTENRFLLQFDIEYRMRRLNFVRRKIDALYALDEAAIELMHWSGVDCETTPSSGWSASFRQELLVIKGELNRAFVVVRKARRSIWARGESTVRSAVVNLGITSSNISNVLNGQNEDERQEYAQVLVDRLSTNAALERFEEQLSGLLLATYEAAAAICSAAFGRSVNSVPTGAETETATGARLENNVTGCTESTDVASPAAAALPPLAADMDPLSAARLAVAYYYDHYEQYDMIAFPLLYSQTACETNHIDIVRISPRDARSLIDERTGSRRKLAGTTLSNFGALLKRDWRVNDMMWGRLDAAETLINTLTPNMAEADRFRLLRRAQDAIISEQLSKADREAIIDWMLKILPGVRPEDRNADALTKLVKAETGSAAPPSLEKVLRSCMDSDEIREFLQSHYEVNREVPASTALVIASRASAVFGSILDGVATEREGGTHAWSRWIARLGQLFSAIVQVAIPDSLGSKFAAYWLSLLYLFELFSVGGGWLLKNSAAESFGFKLLGITLMANYLLYLLSAVMKGQNRILKISKATAIVLVVLLIVVGIRHVAGDFNEAFNAIYERMRALFGING